MREDLSTCTDALRTVAELAVHMDSHPAIPSSEASLHSAVQSGRRGLWTAVIGLGLLPAAWFVAILTQAAQQMSRDSCMGAECHYGLIGFDPWGVRFLILSAVVGVVALLCRPLRIPLVALQLLLLPLPTLICGYP